MSWEKAEVDARRWARESAAGYAVTAADKETRRISFRAPCGSFYVNVPAKPGEEEWMVWSEEESCVQRLVESMEYMSQPKRTLVEVLERAASCLQSVGTDRQNSAADSTASTTEGEEGEEGEEEDEDDDYDPYDYDIDDPDVDVEVKEKKGQEDDDEITADDFFTGQGSAIAVHRLIADLKSLNKSGGKFGITGSPRGDNLFLWDVELMDFEKGTLLFKDLESYAKKHNRKPVLHLEMKFPKDYPMSPPFVRIIRPRFQFLTGHVTVGGSICMELLTRSGWLSTNDIEGILIQVRAEIMSDPRARLDPNPDREYTEGEAKSAFERMVQRYGWNRQPGKR